MNLHNPGAGIFIPDGLPEEEALGRITHLGIGAHHDDLEFMALHGILACHRSGDKWFGGVTCTDGAGSARSGRYALFSDEEMQRVRREEQDAAAAVGNYGVMIQLGYASSSVRNPANHSLKNDLGKILAATRPAVVYTHNPADKHDSHVGVVIAALQAMREMPPGNRPKIVHGCEVWRGLDWMPDREKVVHDVGGHDALVSTLNGIFDSQIAGGKRYDLATLGRRRANATFLNPHSIDGSEGVAFAMDLTPLVEDSSRDIVEYVLGFIHRFADDVRDKLTRRPG